MDRKLGFQTLNDEIFQSDLKAKYKSKIFIGYFKEKRLCEPIGAYRDIVNVDVKTEQEYVKDLENLLNETKDYVRQQVFIGVTAAEDVYTVWTELEDDLPFGKYWFQVKTIKFRSNEIQIKLKKLRPVNDRETNTFTEKLRAATNVGRNDGSQVDNVNEQWRALYEFWSREISAAVAWVLSISVNRQTITETLRFISLVIVSFFAGSTQIVKYLGIFAIKLIERTTWLAHVLTPVALGLFDLISKIVGGFYLLIAMVWRDSVHGRGPQNNNAIEAGPRRKPHQSIRFNHNH